MRRLILTLALGWVCSGIGLAQAPDTLFISASQVVHLRFASELKYVNLGSRDIVAKIVDGSKDFVAVKARAAFDGCTSMSCLEVNGDMHTFRVAYRENPSRLEMDMRKEILRFAQNDRGQNDRGQNDKGQNAWEQNDRGQNDCEKLEVFSGMEQELFHVRAKGYGIEVRCENILVKDDVLYFLITLRNSSAVSYELSSPRFAIENKRRAKRGLQYEKALFPKQVYGVGVVVPEAARKMVFSFDKMALTKGQVLKMYFYEKGGARNLTLTFSERDINL